MKSWKQKGEEEKLKQKYLDEIHVKPDVKKTFVVCEWFFAIDWISNLLFLVVFNIAVWKCDLEAMRDSFDLYQLIDILFESIGGSKTGIILLVAYFIVKALIGRIKKKQQAKLQVLEDAGIIEIEKQVAEGTYVPGPTVSKGYRVYRAIRTWTSIIGILALFAGLLSVVVF